jgi:hypothetical protein
MKFRIQGGLPYVSAALMFRGRSLVLENVLLDTGSAGTIFSANKLLQIEVSYEPDDIVHRIRGVGGTEFVFTKQLDTLSLDELQIHNFEIEVGAMEYGFEIDGIIGTDFLMQTGAVIDLRQFEVYPSTRKE